MLEFLTKRLTAPHFTDDEDKSRRAELLHIFSWATVALVLFYLLTRVMFGGRTIAQMALLFTFIPLHGGVLWLMRRGRVRLSSWLYCLALFGVIYIYAAINPGSRGLALNSLVLVVMATGLLLEFGAAWVMAVASVLVNAVLWHAVTRGILPGSGIERDFVSFVVMHSVLVIAALFVLFVATKSQERALARVKEESAARLRSDSLANRMVQVIDQSPNIVAIADIEGNLEYVNPSFTRITGYPAADVLGKNPRILNSGTHPWIFYRELWDTLRDGQVWQGEFVNRKQDGGLYCEMASISPLRDASGKITHYMKVAEDITSRKQVEQALQESEARFREIAGNIREVFWLFDYLEQRVIYVSPAYEEIWGRTAQALYDDYSEWADSIYPEDRASASTSFGRIAETGGGEPREYRIARPNGEVRWILDRGFAIRDDDGRVVRIAGIAEDVTEQKHAEMASSASMARYRTLFESANDAILIMDDDRFIECNDQTLAMHRCTKAQIVGRTPADLSPPTQPDGADSRQASRSRIDLALQNQPQCFTWRYVRGDGTPFDAEVSLNRFDAAEHVYVLAVVRDITERLQAEARIAHRLEIERLVSQVSANFVHIADVDVAMHASLAELGRYSDAARACLFQIEQATMTLSMAYEWVGEGVDRQSDQFQGVAAADFGWLMAQLQQGELVQIADVSQLPDEASACKACLEMHHVRSLLVAPVFVKGLFIGFIRFDNALKLDALTADDHALLRVTAELVGTALERKRADAALHVHEWALASAINAVAIASLDAKLTYVNKAFLVMWGYTAYEDVLGRPVTEFWNLPEQADAVVAGLVAGGQWMGELAGKRADGALFDVQVSASAILNDAGEVIGLMSSFIDVTERNRMERLLRVSLREKELLLQEVHHRVNNNMQIINSLLHIQASRVSNDVARAVLRQSQDRIRSMALVHEKLYRSADLDRIYVGEYVRNLLSHLFQSYQVDSEEIDLRLDIADDAVLSITVAIPCGLILTELLSNVLRHAFPPAWASSQERASIRVAIASEDGSQVLTVSDNGIGLSTDVDFEEATSVGLQLVKLWVDQIDGSLDVEHTNGTTVRIIFTNPV